MMRITLRVIGIGPGNPRQLTLEAVDALADVDVFLLLDKGQTKQSLADARREILARHAAPTHRVVEVVDPPRDRSPDDYDAEVRRWHRARAAVLSDVLTDELVERTRSHPGREGGLSPQLLCRLVLEECQAQIPFIAETPLPLHSLDHYPQ